MLVRSPGNLDELLEDCPNSECCVLIVESSALLKSTPAQVTELMRRARFLRVVVRVENDEIPKLRDLMLLGCSGFITDDTTLPRFREILGAVARGEMWFPRRLLSQVFQTLVLEQSCNSLSRREREILTLLGQELSNKQIAERLFISQETLRWHLRNLYVKTRVQGRDKLVQYANEFNDVAPRAAAEGQNAPLKKELARPLLFKSSVTS
jgi:DNA-binding NarL/FixJ family response regulator